MGTVVIFPLWTATTLPLWAEYVRALGPAAAIAVGAIAALIAWRSHVRQKRADRHAVVWESLVWAVEQTSETDDIYKARMGTAVLTALAQNPHINPLDLALLEEINDIIDERSLAHNYHVGQDVTTSPRDTSSREV